MSLAKYLAVSQALSLAKFLAVSQAMSLAKNLAVNQTMSLVKCLAVRQYVWQEAGSVPAKSRARSRAIQQAVSQPVRAGQTHCLYLCRAFLRGRVPPQEGVQLQANGQTLLQYPQDGHVGPSRV